MGRSRTPSFFKQPDADGPLSFSLTQLHYFVTAAHTLNLTRAARECPVSQPSISGAVHHLEEMFCTQLFHRDPSRGLSLTTSGTQLQELAESLLLKPTSLNPK
jgi:DNA-binding transcriptional LysR family regulator